MRYGISSMALLVLASAVAISTRSESLPEATTFQVDPIHSSILFRARHAGVANFYGRFNEVEGSFTVQEGGTGSVDITIAAGSVDTGNDKRDAHLKSPDFLSAAQFPKITFESSALKHVEGDRYQAKAAGSEPAQGNTRLMISTVSRSRRWVAAERSRARLLTASLDSPVARASSCLVMCKRSTSTSVWISPSRLMSSGRRSCITIAC